MFIILFINDYKENIIDFYLRMIPCENKLELNNNGHIEFLKNCLVYIWNIFTASEKMFTHSWLVMSAIEDVGDFSFMPYMPQKWWVELILFGDNEYSARKNTN